MTPRFVVFAYGHKALFNVPSARLIVVPENNWGVYCKLKPNLFLGIFLCIT